MALLDKIVSKEVQIKYLETKKDIKVAQCKSENKQTKPLIIFGKNLLIIEGLKVIIENAKDWI